MNSQHRVYYMDNLRAFAMLLGVFFHAALAYSPLMNEVWLSSSQDNAAYIDFIAFFSHGFRMPLFFLVAGFFGALLLEKRGVKKSITHRLMRIFLPLVIFLPMLVICVVIIIGWAMKSVENPSPMLSFIIAMSQNPDAPPPPPSTMHLWFLYYLTMFFMAVSLLVWAVRQFSLNFVRNTVNGLGNFACKHPVVFLLILPLLLVPALMSQHTPLPAPEHFTPALWAFGFHGLFFVSGWLLYKQDTLIERIQTYMWPMLGVGIICYIGFYTMMPKSFSFMEAMQSMGTPPELNLKQGIKAVLEAYLSMYMSLGLLLLAKRFFYKQNAAMMFVSKSSYWVYIIHLPIIWVIQFLLLDTDLPMLVEFAISSFGTIAIGFITYVAFVKWTPIGWLLNGRKKNYVDTHDKSYVDTHDNLSHEKP